MHVATSCCQYKINITTSTTSQVQLKRMQCILLIMALICAMSILYANAGRVTINGACVDCNRPYAQDRTTRKPATRYGNRSPTYSLRPAPQPRRNDDWEMDGWTMHQTANGGQHMTYGGGPSYRW